MHPLHIVLYPEPLKISLNKQKIYSLKKQINNKQLHK